MEASSTTWDVSYDSLRDGSAAWRGLPSTRRDIHDDSRRGTKRTPQHDSLLMMPGITVRLPFRIASIVIAATASALFIEWFAIQP